MDPIELAALVEERYRRYLETTFFFRDPDLRRSFTEALKSGRLSKGPYLEATSVFKPGLTPRTLFTQLLGREPDEGFLAAVNGERLLYQHQEQAIRKVDQGRNVVVATGTGSGKTEAFLYPILLHLYRESLTTRLEPGVRALVLYPMNALANDQRDRLGEVCARLDRSRSHFRLTFGQYIGDTPEDETDARRQAQRQVSEALPGESTLRAQMREAPPHILLTNYSMLEYLLLRPDDSPLFDNGRARWWTYLVLDEAHQYRGSRGTEMAMLLRRLKRRLREGGFAGRFRCIATSATLVGGKEDRAAVARFATDLFGEEFLDEDIVLGDAEPVPEPQGARLPPADYRTLALAISDGEVVSEGCVADMAERLDCAVDRGNDPARVAGGLLQSDRRVQLLRRLITGNPVEADKVANAVFEDIPEGERLTALARLVDLLQKAKAPGSEAPILSARYHFFLRSLEGAFVSYWPEKKVFLDRQHGTGHGQSFEVALCRQCGQHYFVAGRGLRDGRLEEAVRDPAALDFGATFYRPLGGLEADGDEDEGEEGPPVQTVLNLCMRCGQVAPGQPPCGHAETIRVVREDPTRDEDRADQIVRCGACGYRSAGDPVREVVHGTDGPHAVIATTIHQHLPPGRKKLLAFADGRQEAAFFAWYLEESYRSILHRNILLSVTRSLDQYTASGLSLRELTNDMQSVLRKRGVVPPTFGDLDVRREAWLAVYREFLTPEPRISLEGVGLIRWALKWPDWLPMPGILGEPPWSLSEAEARAVLQVLMDSLRLERAVELRTDAAINLAWEDLALQLSPLRVRVGEPRGQRDVRSWDGRRGRRARWLQKILTHGAGLSEVAAEAQAVDTLRTIWEEIKCGDDNAPRAQDRLLLQVEDAKRANPDWWRLYPIAETGQIFRCETCGQTAAVSVLGICPRPGCPGTLVPTPASALVANHYRLLYQADLPDALRVEEHTAQLDREKAREYQREFKAGKIHVLSCSTTFELGVDLGDLDTVFLRNVPPEPFNYAQRVGRAGRRRGHPGFALTYCRRAPHDLYHFAEPERMVRGKVRPPVISLRNEKIITRHLTAVALSAYFRAHPDRFKTVEKLLEDMGSPSGLADLRAFLARERASMEPSLRAIVPPESHLRLGLDDEGWIAKVAGEDGRFANAEREVASDYQSVRDLERDASERGRHNTAQWAADRARTIAREDVLSFLSRKAVIPKYGFPVDVVELDMQPVRGMSQETTEVLLQRDLRMAIAEFAPTNRLIANKHEWTSYGLKKVAAKEWERRLYKRCSKHNVFVQWREGEPEPPMPCGDAVPTFEYVWPQFGFVSGRGKPSNPRGRPLKMFTTRPYFAGSLEADPGTLTLPAGSPMIEIKRASPGLMVVLCEGKQGRGFYICGNCGAGFGERKRPPHKTYLGRECRGTLKRVSLGHEFVTDVLQVQFLTAEPMGMEPLWFAYSLACALVEGAAQALEVPSTDLSAVVASGDAYAIPPIVLYDDVPGGAGLVAQLENGEVFKRCLKAALERVAGGCGCGEDASCYGCLRNYGNQFAHQQLKRGPVAHYLTKILAEWS
ncbi:MAG: DEAD/DEAH box helicase [Dehalococcoidales bacterium]|nr:DEAD/DEAH box helicase [Dehalococcoidales bacterium]